MTVGVQNGMDITTTLTMATLEVVRVVIMAEEDLITTPISKR